MATPNENEFVNEGLSEEDQAAIAAEQDRGDESAEDVQDQPEASRESPSPAPQQPDEQPRTVDIRALQEARSENRQLRENHARLEERTNMILQQLQKQPEAAQDSPPDPNEDIFAYTKWHGEQLKKVQDRLQQRDQQDSQMQQQHQEDQRIMQEWNRSVQSFAQETPDFNDAANWMAGLRMQQLSTLGLDPQSVNTTIDNEVKGIVRQAKQIGANPAELVYNYAKASGYQKPAPTPADPQRDVQDMAERQERHKSLSDAAGGEPPKQLDAKTLANMSDSQFKKLMDDPKTRKQVDHLMGISG